MKTACRASRIKDEICDKTLVGEYGNGSRLPSVRATAKAMPVSSATALRVYRELADEGIIDTRPGVGCRIADGAVDIIRAKAVQELRTAILPEFFKKMWLAGVTLDEVAEKYREYLECSG